MIQKRYYNLIITLVLIISSCKVDPSVVGNKKLKKIKQPEKTVFRDLEIDTTKLFGVWAQDTKAVFPDFNITKESFNIIDFEDESVNPYILEKNKIMVFYKKYLHKGIITLTEKDSLIIKWLNPDTETIYVKYKIK